MTIIETLCLNNLAVEHLQNGQFKNAIKQLRLALDGVKLFLRENVLAASSRERLRRDAAMEMDLHAQQQQTISAEVVSIMGNDHSTNVLPLFCKAFRIQPNTASDPLFFKDARRPSFLVGAILFNLSVAYHCRGACNKVQDLSNALKLYNVALSMLQNELSDDTLPTSGESAILLMAILNNIASIHAHSFDAKKALLYLNCLRDVVVQYCGLASNAAFREQYSFFESNVLVTDASFHLAPVA